MGRADAMTGDAAEMKRILIADDQELVRFVVKRALEKLGMFCELATVDGGRAALDALEDDEFHLVITDLKMPDVGGVELTEEIRARRYYAAVVWITACGCESLLDKADRLRVLQCLEKPFEASMIRDVARKALQDGQWEKKGDATWT